MSDHKVLCLLYHRVRDVRDRVVDMSVDIQAFETQMKYISSHYPLIKYDEDWRSIKQSAIAITFDDGYSDNYQNAFPIIKKYQVPTTFFISSGMVGNNERFWWDTLESLLLDGESYPAFFELDDTDYRYGWETKTFEQRKKLVRILRWLLRLEPNLKRAKKWFSQIADWSGLDEKECITYKDNATISEDELKLLSDNPLVTVGGHTVNHCSLGAMSYEQQQIEITDSINQIGSLLNNAVMEAFSYPFGSQSDYNADTLRICRDVGIKKAATTMPDAWNSEIDDYCIPRVAIKTNDIYEFQDIIDGYLS